MALLVARRTNDRKVAGSRPTKVVCITVLTGNCMGWTARCGRPPLLPSCRNLEFRLSALMDSDLAWVNGKSGRQSWRYADAFQRSIISEAIYHFIEMICAYVMVCSHYTDWCVCILPYDATRPLMSRFLLRVDWTTATLFWPAPPNAAYCYWLNGYIATYM